MTAMGSGSVKRSKASSSPSSGQSATSSRAIWRTRGVMCSMRRGVKARMTCLRIAVCAGGSITMIVGSSGLKPEGTMPSPEAKVSGSLTAATTSSWRERTNMSRFAQ